MGQAAVEGAVDFATADLLDPCWWRRLDLLLDGLEHRNLQAVRHNRYLLHLAGAGSPDPVHAAKHLEQADTVRRQLLATAFPYYEQAGTVDIQQAADALSAAWKKHWGDPNDPAVAERIRRTVEAMTRGKKRM